MRKSSTNVIGGWVALLTLFLHPPAVGRADGLRVLMASGDAAPYAGAPAMNLTENSFNAQGQVAAVVMLPPVGSSSWERLVVASRPDGTFRVVARESMPLPGAPAGDNYISPYTPPVINGHGQVAFEASIYPNGYPPSEYDSFYETLWSEAGGLHVVDTRLNEWHHRRYITLQGLADNGNVLYGRGGYSDGSSVIVGDDPELLIEENGVSQHLFRRYSGAPVGGCPPGQICSIQQDFLFGSALNPDGTAIYGMQVKGFGITTLNNDVILRRAPGGATTMIRDGDPAWGLPSGYRFSHVIAPDFLSNGEFVFQSYLDTPTGTELQYSIFANTGGVERLIARHGAPAPGFGGSRTFTSFSNFYATETGRPVVEAQLSGTDYKHGVFREAGGQLSLVVESDQPAPGIDGAILPVFAVSLHDSPVTGASILSADWFNPQVSSSGTGLWRIDQGEWQLLLSTGQSFEVSPGDFRTIDWLSPQTFTSSGMLPIGVMFSDGTRALVSWTDTPQRLAGDANGDGIVDAADYVMWRKGLGQAVLGGYGADFNGDRMIGQADLDIWKMNFGASAVLAGDFNDDGKVDTADYVVWRKHVGTNTSLPNDIGLDAPVGGAHFNLWRMNFGSGSPGGGAFTSTVPEPASLIFVCLAIAPFVWRPIDGRPR
jgi:hypothetical protein